MRPELPVLIKARAKIADPANWGKGIRGSKPPWRPLSTCCASEAIEQSAPSVFEYPERRAALDALRKAADICPSDDITGWNDQVYRTHAQVLAAFDKAIASAS